MLISLYFQKKKKKRQKQVPPYPRKQRRRVNNFWKVTVVTRSPHQDERARSMWELLPPCRRGRPEPLVSQLVSSLLSCKFCTKNCYFSLFCRWWFCCVCVFVFFFNSFPPGPLYLRLCPPVSRSRKLVALRHRWGTWAQRRTSLPLAVFCLIVQLRK